LGLILAVMRKGAEAKLVFEKALALDLDDAWAHYDLVCLDALKGNSDATFGSLNRAVDCGFRKLAHPEQDEDFKGVRKGPPWVEILHIIPRDVKDRTKGCLACQSQGSQRVQ
jgi:hypothetical protein